MILGVTGHRPPRLGGYKNPSIRGALLSEITLYLREFKKKEHIDFVYTGMALGFDQYVAWSCLTEGIPFKAIIPFWFHSHNWSATWREEYSYLLKQSAEVINVADKIVDECIYPELWRIAEDSCHEDGVNLPRNHISDLIYARDKYVVDSSDRLLACWDGKKNGGTWKTIQYAQSLNKPIDYISLEGIL